MKLTGAYARHYKEERFRTFWGRRTMKKERKALSALLELASPLEGPWLDMPCGTGRLAGLLPRAVCCDLNPAMLRLLEPARPAVRASGLALPFRDGAFEGVLSIRFLPHLADSSERIQALSEMARVSRRWVLVSFFHALSLQEARRKAKEVLFHRRRGRKSITFRRFRGEARAAGLQVRAVRPLARFLSEQWLVLCRVRDSGSSGPEDGP